jgi:uroporphyrinogen decarboxylase
MKQYRENPRNAADAHIAFAEACDLDAVFIDVDTCTTAGAVGVPVDYPEHEPARISAPLLECLEEVDYLQPVDISLDGYVQNWLEICRLVKEHFGDEKHVRGNCDQAPFSLACLMRGNAAFMMELLSGDERIFHLLDYCQNICLQFIDLMSETGVDMVSNGDSIAGPEMISPDMYRSFALPYETELVRRAHEKDIPYCLHICGNTEKILSDMLETGSDAFELDYKTSTDKIVTVCKNKVTIIGTIDPSGVMTLGNVEDVEEAALSLLRAFHDTPRFIMNSGCALPPSTPPENIRRLVGITHSYMDL